MNRFLSGLFGLLLILISGWYVDYLLRDEIISALTWTFRGLAAAILVMAAIAVLYFAFRVREAYYLSRAQRRQAEREAGLIVTVAPPGHQVFISEMAGLSFAHRPIHTSPGLVNGKPAIYTEEESRRWWAFNALHSTAHQPDKIIEMQPAAQLAAPLPEQVNLSDHIGGSVSLDSLFLGIGRYPDGRVEPVRRALASLVHVCAGGASGFGKSVFMQSLAYQALIAREQAEFTFLDAQAVTFQVFGDSDRLRYPVVSDEQDVKRILADVAGEMKRRKELFSHWRGVFSLGQYNNVTDEPLPWLPVFYDEFGLHAKDRQIGGLVDAIAKGGRKFGIYLLASSQTWYSSEIASSLKANLSSAFQFYVPGKSQSRVLIDDSRAVELSRPGQCYARLPGQAGLIEMQAPDCSSLLDVTPVMIEAAGWHIPEPVEDEPESPDDIFVRLVEDEGMSRSEASRLAFGKDYAGTSHVQRCKRLLGEI